MIFTKLVSRLYAFQYFNRQKYVNRQYRKRKTDVSIGAPLAAEQPRRVLFVVAGLLGDSVMSTPALIAARKIWKRSHFTVLGQKHNCELLAACPLVDEFYVTPVIPFSLRKRHLDDDLRNWLRAQNFDLAVVLSGGQFGAVLAEAEIPVRACSHLNLLPDCYTHLYDGATPRTWGPAEQLNSLRCLGFEVEHVAPRLWVEDAARETAREKLKALGLGENQSYVAVHPFGSTPRQWWQPEKNVVPLAQALKADRDLRTVLLGGKETVGRVAQTSENEIVDATGQLTLPELLAVIDEARLTISTDSGPFHIAGALGKPLVGIFRARRPEHAGHYGKTRVVFGENEICRSACEWDRCRADPCRQMSAISPQQIIRAVDELLAESVV